MKPASRNSLLARREFRNVEEELDQVRAAMSAAYGGHDG
jgi:hypothetical protein